MYLITNDFLKNLSKDNKKDIVLKKLSQFENQMIEKEIQIRNLPKGFWVRKIKNTEIYKFRLNNGDRILFTYIDSKKNNINQTKSILFLDYVNHDNQIIKAKNISIKNSKNKSTEFNIYKAKESDTFDELDDKNVYVKKYEELGYLDLENIISLVVEDRYIKYLLDKDNEDYLYYLSDKQFECVKAFGKPIIVTGAAGSGKTTVALHKLLSIGNDYSNVLYITYTELLYDNAKSLFRKFSKSNNINNKTDFYFFNQFYKEKLNISMSYIVKLSKFIEWYKANSFKFKKSKKLNPIDIYAEIRGIIKGYIGLEGKLIKNLDTNKNRILSLEEYKNLPNSYSIYDNNTKEIIYEVFEKYQIWLDENNLYDENDLAIKIIDKINKNEVKRYDYIIVDEVQDLSEIQIYMISMLLKNPNNIMYCGDIHQIINPTFFNFSRLKNIYYGLGVETSLFCLNKNYRNTIEIINLLNKISEDRQKLIGKTSYDYIETGIVNSKKPKLLKYDKKIIKETLEEIKDKHYCAVIVPSNEEKEKLISICKEIGGRIFLPNEIKGLEYENVYCFNMITSNLNHYEEIYKGEGKNKNKYKYYFNILYVALSRGKKNLCLFEERNKNIVLESLEDKLDVINNFEKSTLEAATVSSKKDWIKEADRLKKVDIIEKSKFARNKAEEEDIKNRNKSCDEYYYNIYNNILDNETKNDNLNRNDENEIEKILNEGLFFYKRRNYSTALEYYEKALKLDENYYKTYYYMANAFSYMINGMSKSIEYYNRCIDLNNQFYLAYIDKAAILEQLHKYEESISTLKRAIEINPNIGNAYFNLSHAYDDYFSREDPDMNSLSDFNLKRMQELKSCLEKGMKSEIFYSWDNINKIWNLSDKSDVLNKKAILNKALSSLKKDYSKYFESENVNKKKKENICSNMTYLQIFNKATILALENKFNEAIDLYNVLLKSDFLEKWAEEVINSPKIMNNLKLMTKDNFENEEEIVNYFKAELLNNKGRALLGLKNNSDAIVCFDQAIKYSPYKYTTSYLSLGDVYFNMQNYIQSRRYFTKAIELGNKRGYIGIANISLVTGRYKDGLDNIDKYLEVDTKDTFANQIKIKLTAEMMMKRDKGYEIRNMSNEEINYYIINCKNYIKNIDKSFVYNNSIYSTYIKNIIDYKL